MKYAWLTDIHLDFLDKKQRDTFYQQVNNCGADTILITGDISNGTKEGRDILWEIDHTCDDVLFVLGNHDYYGGEISKIREEEPRLHRGNCFYLGTGASCRKKRTLIIGVDGWADGRYGDFEKARKGIELNDHRHIWDFADLGDPPNTHYNNEEELMEAIKRRDYAILKKRQEWADIDAKLLEETLRVQAFYGLDKVDRIIILTHIPPFPEVCRYHGQPTSDTFLPYYSCKATGDVIMKAAQDYPDIQFLVLCGHTHGKAEYKPLDNLTVKAGRSEYSKPTIQEIFE